MLDKTTVTAPPPLKQAKAKPKARSCPPPVRRKHLARLVVWRHDRLPHDGWRYVKVAAELCPDGPGRREALRHWFELVCAEALTRRQADDILDRVPSRHWSADGLGKHLRVTDAERAALRIHTIGSYQTPKAERTRQRKESRRLADKARRQARGATPHELSLSRTKPWEAFGIKRRAWELRGKPTPPPTTQIRGHESSSAAGLEFAQSSTVRCSNGRRVERNARRGRVVADEDRWTSRRGKAFRLVMPAPEAMAMRAVAASRARVDRVFGGLTTAGH